MPVSGSLRVLITMMRRAQVLSLAGELLGNAEGLLRDGLHTSEIADGYQRASAKVRAVEWALCIANNRSSGPRPGQQPPPWQLVVPHPLLASPRCCRRWRCWTRW